MRVSHFHPSLIISCKAKSLPLKWSPVKGSSWVGSKFASRQGLKLQTLTNTLAYYNAELIMP
jgi:hypothetical protein